MGLSSRQGEENTHLSGGNSMTAPFHLELMKDGMGWKKTDITWYRYSPPFEHTTRCERTST